MKKFKKQAAYFIIIIASILPLTIFANVTLPFLEPVLKNVAILSAYTSFTTKTDVYSNVFLENERNKNIDIKETVGDILDYQVNDTKDKNNEEEVVSNIEEQNKPENAGTIKRTTYKNGTGTNFIKIKDAGYIKNCTSLTVDKIKSVSSQSPTFDIKANGEPEVLIMHTHATECYQSSSVDWFDKSAATRTTNEQKNMIRVGNEIEKQLKNAGIGVIHDTTLHDYPSYNGSYDRSAVTVKNILKQYPSIKVVLDVHRDAIQTDSNTIIAPTTTIDGKSCAQVMIISGCDDGTMNMPNYLENLKFASLLQNRMEKDYPTLTRPILFDYRKYNQNLTTGSILLEMGGHANSLEEAIYCGELVGKSLVKALKTLK